MNENNNLPAWMDGMIMPKTQTILQWEPPYASAARVAEVEGALRPYLPALEIANPGSGDLLRVGTHPEYWIAYFRRPLLADHAGPFYPPDVAEELRVILDRLEGRGDR